MKRTTWIFIALAAWVAAPAFAADAKVEPTVEPTIEAAAKEEIKEETKETSESKPAASASHKSNSMATTLAIIPGFAIHGVGHMYAGSWIKGSGLLAIEGVSIWLGVRYGTEYSSDFNKVFNTSNNQVPSDLGPVYSRVGILVVATTAFLYTWFDDMAGASKAVDVYNKKADQAARASLQLAPSGDGLVMVYKRQF